MASHSRLHLAALSSASALGLARVFGGRAWIVPVLGAAVAPHLLAALGRRRRWSATATAAATVGGGILWTLWAALPDEVAFGLPRASAPGALGDALGQAPEVLRAAVVPVAPEGAALVLAVVAAWAVASLGEWFAGSVPGSLVVVVPSLVLLVVVAALGEGGSLVAAAAYAAAVGALLLAQCRRDRAPAALTPDGPARRSRGLVGGVAVIVAAVAVAAVSAPRLPGAAAPPLLDYRGIGDGGRDGRTVVLVSPLVDLRGDLVRPDPVELFTVEADRPARWRLIGLERFDGDVWGLEDDAEPARGALTPTARGTVPLEQRYVLGPLDRRLLPAAYRPVAIDDADATVVVGSDTLVLSAPTVGREYTVRSQVPVRTPDELRRAPTTDVPADLVGLPDDFPPLVRAEAQRITAGQSTTYDRALALQEHLRTFEYTTAAPAGHSSRAIERFLFESRAGYCEQFAGSFAAMARALGIPTRVAVGFQPGDLVAPGRFSVSTDDAHAWPEVYFGPELGWVGFEPTPTRFDRAPGDPNGTGALAPVADPPPGDDPPSTPTTTAPGAPAPTPPPSSPPGVVIGPPEAQPAADTVTEGVPRVLLVAAAVAGLAGLAALGAAALVLTSKARRRSRRRGADDRRAQVHGAWAEALDRLAEAGVRERASATPVEFALRVAPAQGAGAAGEPLMDLAHLETEARWAPGPPSEVASTAAWDAVDRLEHALVDPLPRPSRWRRRLTPARRPPARAGR